MSEISGLISLVYFGLEGLEVFPIQADLIYYYKLFNDLLYYEYCDF